MCGIAGIGVTPDRVLPGLRDALDAMGRAMVPRGPDDEGLYVSPQERCGLITRRLAIRDLSPAGHMPMSIAEGTVWITYNGEIYNTDELTRELCAAGCSFRSTSDTEVILHGYAVWGDRVVDRLRGMFAFGICDLRKDSTSPRLFLARDRLGIKPLYYATVRKGFLFASELRALRASGFVTSRMSSVATVAYLMTGSVPSPLTIFEDIHALEPGCTLVCHNGVVEKHRYWTLPLEEEQPHDYERVVHELRDTLADAVRSHLVSDVPLGAFLSGGLDSSTVVCLMRQATSGVIRTCSIVFEEAEYSEARYARAVADAIGTEHFERVVTGAELDVGLDQIVLAMDQPTSDGVNTYLVAQTARQAGLTVALSGLGGDELFGGYPNTFDQVPLLARAIRATHAVPGATSLARGVLGALPGSRRWSGVRDALSRPASLPSAYVARRSVFSPSEARDLVAPDVWQQAQSYDPVRHVADRAGSIDSSFGWIGRAELAAYTHPQLLRDTDVMSMAHSLEVRVPLLDHRLVEMVLRLPASFKQRGGGQKPLLTAAVADMLPELVRERTDKQGFTLPFDTWLTGRLRHRVEAALTESPLANSVLERRALDELWRSYLARRVHWSRPWAVAALAMWQERAGATF